MGYWDIPDGTKCGEKTWLTTKIATGLGVMGSTYHVVIFQPKTVMEGIKRAGGATLTMAALGAIFGMTTCLTAQIREKPDDAIKLFYRGLCIWYPPRIKKSQLCSRGPRMSCIWRISYSCQGSK
ncbi:unnamed protein product [Staurois parvus]|uniref:NADH dehydrogenase [ubiquinone] 1 alpha subcomplex subunit 11 n=1 Tax=Staurois parvus TaxID=386267 RepID=A0ABN9DM05_9NEOB|nr:unnamed protein product [Staurois parvus]